MILKLIKQKCKIRRWQWVSSAQLAWSCCLKTTPNGMKHGKKTNYSPVIKRGNWNSSIYSWFVPLKAPFIINLCGVPVAMFDYRRVTIKAVGRGRSSGWLSRKKWPDDARKWSYLEAPDPEKRSGMDWATYGFDGYRPVIKHGNWKTAKIDYKWSLSWENQL